MKKRLSILEFQSTNSIAVSDPFPFQLMLEDPERKKLFDSYRDEFRKLLPGDTFRELGQDVFFSLYNRSCRLLDAEYVRLRFLFNRMLMENLIQRDSHTELRTGRFNTVYNKVASFQATLILLNEIIENLKKSLDESDRERLDKASDALDALDQKQGRAAKTKGGRPAKGGPNPADLAEEARNVLRPFEEKTAAAVKQAIDNALKTITDSDEALSALFGGPFRGSEKGELMKIPIHRRVELAKKVKSSDKLKEIVRLLGRFRLSALKKQIEKLSQNPQEFSDVKKGADLENVLPEELMQLQQGEERRQDVLIRLMREELLEFERKPRKEKQNVEKGPIVMCVDCSGSMTGEKEYKAKALALAVADIAYIEKRQYACVLFSSASEVETVVINPKEKMDTVSQKVIDIASHFYGGGTDFEAPLRTALRIIEDDQFSKADIIFLTDGFADVSSQFLAHFQEIKQKKQMRTVGLLCDATDSERTYGRSLLEKFCDEVKCSSSIEKDLSFSAADNMADDLFLML